MEFHLTHFFLLFGKFCSNSHGNLSRGCSKTTELTKLPSLDISSKIEKLADFVVRMFAEKGNAQLDCRGLIFL